MGVDAKVPVVATEAATKGNQGVKGQEEKSNSDQELQNKEEKQKQAL